MSISKVNSYSIDQESGDICTVQTDLQQIYSKSDSLLVKGAIKMSTCAFTETCLFFNNQMAGMPATAATFKKIFCEQDFDSCGRYMILKAIGRENVPNDLYPNQSDRAKEIIAAHKN